LRINASRFGKMINVIVKEIPCKFILNIPDNKQITMRKLAFLIDTPYAYANRLSKRFQKAKIINITQREGFHKLDDFFSLTHKGLVVKKKLQNVYSSCNSV